MPRNFYEATLGAPDLAGNFKVFSGLRISLFYRGTTNPANVYQRETGVTLGPSPEAGATSGPNPFITGPTGSVQFWADLGRYDIFVEDTVAPARIATRTIQWNSVALDEIPGSSLADLAVGTAKLADLAVATAKINDLAVTTPKLVDLGVSTAKIGAKQVTAPKIEDPGAWTMLPTVSPGGTGSWVSGVEYYKDQFGVVRFHGSLTLSGAPGSPMNIASMPAGFRPGINAYFAVPRTDNPAAGCIVTMAAFIAYTTGAFQALGSPGSWAAGTYQFNQVSYRAEL
jgi:hypothetical protein